VKITKRKAKLEWKWKRPRLELRRLAHEEDPTLKSLFKQRAGGESTNAELKNSMGLERIRRRGFEATKLVVFLAATALNIRIMHGWLRRKALEKLSNIDSMLAKWLILTLLGAMTSLSSALSRFDPPLLIKIDPPDVCSQN
jgi:hypothetical protein